MCLYVYSFWDIVQRALLIRNTHSSSVRQQKRISFIQRLEQLSNVLWLNYLSYKFYRIILYLVFHHSILYVCIYLSTIKSVIIKSACCREAHYYIIYLELISGDCEKWPSDILQYAAAVWFSQYVLNVILNNGIRGV